MIHYLYVNDICNHIVFVKWYDNDNSRYRPFEDDESALEQLEASFQGNVKQNYDPSIYEKQFNNCLLTELRQYFEKRAKSKRFGRSYSLRVTFSDQNANHEEWSNIILSMEQITFKTKQLSTFPRNLKRVKDGRNSLDFLYRNSDRFTQVLSCLCSYPYSVSDWFIYKLNSDGKLNTECILFINNYICSVSS